MRRLRPFLRRFDSEARWRRTQRKLQDGIARSIDSAIGPDGIPYLVYSAVGDLAASVLLAVYSDMMDGRRAPADWNDGTMVFLAKKSVDMVGRVMRRQRGQ